MEYTLQNLSGIALQMDPLSVESRLMNHDRRHQSEPKDMTLDEYLEKVLGYGVNYNEESGVASFRISGMIWKGASAMDEYWWGLYNTDRVARNLDEISRKRGITAVEIIIDTPGGMARGTREAAQSVLAFKQSTGHPVVATVPNIAASAGYYIAVGADSINADPSALVGSIGTMAVAVDSSELYKKYGYNVKLYTGGADLKGMGTPGVEWTKAWHQKMESNVNELKDEFISFVKTNRPGISEDSFRGDAFEARKAPKGMVDYVGPV